MVSLRRITTECKWAHVQVQILSEKIFQETLIRQRIKYQRQLEVNKCIRITKKLQNNLQQIIHNHKLHITGLFIIFSISNTNMETQVTIKAKMQPERSVEGLNNNLLNIYHLKQHYHQLNSYSNNLLITLEFRQQEFQEQLVNKKQYRYKMRVKEAIRTKYLVEVSGEWFKAAVDLVSTTQVKVLWWMNQHLVSTKLGNKCLDQNVKTFKIACNRIVYACKFIILKDPHSQAYNKRQLLISLEASKWIANQINGFKRNITSMTHLQMKI